MSLIRTRFIYLFPRVLAILIVGFFAIFVLEGFDANFGWQDGLAHLALTLAALAAAVVAWKWPKIGGWPFLLFGGMALSEALKGEWTSLLVGGVPFVTGILFLIEGFGKRKTARNPESA